MDFLITSLLNVDEACSLRLSLESEEQFWLDGRLTAGRHAAEVKRNRQLSPDCPAATKAAQFVKDALCANQLIKTYGLIKKVHGVMFSRCDPGDGYGLHVDNPFTKQGRRDLSFTLFLSDPSQYQGGALRIQGLQDSSEHRLLPGQVILYPSSSLHAVDSVNWGRRIVCVGWIESHVKSSEDRALLFNLECGARGLLARHGRSDELDLIYQSYSNAVRRLAD
ncbi:Fe2+-dependent dioxygenase [Synechococcus sp. A15-127]|uniref:Fe2+-dependent dioxygenase n=1 Tax=Synechococcus sp. A15-127 TaxID=1050624 RepID=UPI0016457778|nr:Fe2+-dependent dioxygenase [Synechococcus sp. A15-127]